MVVKRNCFPPLRGTMDQLFPLNHSNNQLSTTIYEYVARITALLPNQYTDAHHKYVPTRLTLASASSRTAIGELTRNSTRQCKASPTMGETGPSKGVCGELRALAQIPKLRPGLPKVSRVMTLLAENPSGAWATSINRQRSRSNMTPGLAGQPISIGAASAMTGSWLPITKFRIRRIGTRI